jgi:hypothetical protein
MQAEALCEKHIRCRERGESLGALANAAASGCASLVARASSELDATVRELARMMASQELELARGILQLHRADGWRRLGYASESQYARERLGSSQSSLIARRSLALRLERLPRIAEALGTALIGVEAALQIVRVATSNTEGAWVERARRRTIKVSVRVILARLAAHAGSGHGLRANLRSGLLSVHEPGVQSQGRDAASPSVSLGGRG